VGLWSRYWSRGHLFEGVIHKTHELVYDFRPSGQGLDGPARFAAFGARLIAVADGRHNLASRVYGDFPLYPLEGWPRYEQSALAAVASALDPAFNPGKSSSFEIEREKYDFYDVWKFGDGAKGGFRHFGQYLELDIPYCLMVHFARTGDLRFFREAELCTRGLLDVPAHGGGYGHQAGEPSHYYAFGPMLYSCVAAEPFLRDAVRSAHHENFSYSMGEQHEEKDPRAAGLATDYPGPRPWHFRSCGVTIWSNLTMYQYFPADRATYRKGLEGGLAYYDAIKPNPLDTLVFHVGIASDALGLYCQRFPEDQKRRERLVAIMREWLNATKDLPAAQRKERGELTLANAFAYAARYSGEQAFFKYAADNLKDEDFSTAFRTGTSAGKNWSEFGHRLTQVFLHDLDKKNHPEKYKDLP
jgi:hypothetical protein